MTKGVGPKEWTLDHQGQREDDQDRPDEKEPRKTIGERGHPQAGRAAASLTDTARSKKKPTRIDSEGGTPNRKTRMEQAQDQVDKKDWE